MKCIFFISLFLLCTGSFAQAPYRELADPHVPAADAWKQWNSPVAISFASADIRVKKSDVPSLASIRSEWQTTAWKGEKVHTQLLLWTNRLLKEINFDVDDLKDSRGNTIASRNVSIHFIRYVMTDGLNSEGGGCGIQRGQDSSLVADVLDNARMLDVQPRTTQPVWLSIAVPAGARAGVYHATVHVREGKLLLGKLSITLNVADRTLPAPATWQYHLDLWQNPYASARVYNVTPWTKAHFRVMRPEMQRLAAAGQKAITASIIHDPWNSQTNDIYQSMVRWIKRKDGSWYYDYTVFDQWVTYMMSLGIDKIINCYSMIPWNHKFYYFDEALGKEAWVVAKPGTVEYDHHWRPMLVDFTKHLRAKGWFSKTAIAMDERPLDDMMKAIALVKSVDKDLAISLAGNYHAEFEDVLVDYSIPSNQSFDVSKLSRRKAMGYTTTYYTCCTEGYPNTFTFSPPAESAWLAWFAVAKGYDGYLRWAYNCWPKNPLQDSRFGTWSAGDAFLIYPGNRSSVRFERLLEGIQDAEKIRLLREEFTRNNLQDKLKKLQTILASFELQALKATPAGTMVHDAHHALNDLAGL
jgi:hypothetical protein